MLTDKIINKFCDKYEAEGPCEGRVCERCQIADLLAKNERINNWMANAFMSDDSPSAVILSAMAFGFMMALYSKEAKVAVN